MKTESFWDSNETEEEQETYSNDILMIPKTMIDIERELHSTKEDMDYLEILRAKKLSKLIELENLYRTHISYESNESYEKLAEKIDKQTIRLSTNDKGNILKIRLNFLLPMYQKIKNNKFAYYEALQDVYRKEISQYLYLHRGQIPSFIRCEKVYVLIVQYFNSNIITDLDNRFHSIIFNALRSAKITPDDRWQRLSYMEDARYIKGEPYTEVIVGDYVDMENIIRYSQE